MIKKIAFIMAIILIVVTPLFAQVDQQKKTETQKIYKMRLSHGLPPQHPWAKTLEAFGKLVEEKSNGRMVVEIFPAAQLFSDAEIYEAVKKGMIEGGSFFLAYLQPNIKTINAIGTVGTIWNKELEDKVIKGFINNEGPLGVVVKEIEAAGLKPLAWFSTGATGSGSGFAGTGKPVELPNDLNGRKVRTLGQLDVKIVSSFGGRPAMVSGADLYTGMQRNTYDLTFLTPAHLVDRKLAEVADWYTAGLPGSALQQFILIVNLKYFNSLPADLQEALVAAGREMTEKCLISGSEHDPYKNNIANIQKAMEIKKGFKVVYINNDQLKQWADKSAPMINEFLKALGPETVRVFNTVSDMQKELNIPYNYIK